MKQLKELKKVVDIAFDTKTFVFDAQNSECELTLKKVYESKHHYDFVRKNIYLHGDSYKISTKSFQIFKDENSTNFYWRTLVNSSEFGKRIVKNITVDGVHEFFKEVDFKTALKKSRKFIRED